VTNDAENTLLSTRGLSKSYGDFAALTGLDLAVRPGEVFALLGPNGAGKTTTIKLVMGLLRPTAGGASLAGLDCFRDRAEAKRYVGYLPDEPVFPDHLRGHELVRFVGAMHGVDPDTIEARARPMYERLELADAASEYAVNYSQGMRKKLALVCATIHDPPLLLLDEPTAGLDPYATRALQAYIRERADAGGAVFITTHLLEQAERFCDRVGILSRGRLAAAGSLPDLRAGAGLGVDADLEALFFAYTHEHAAP